MISYSKQLKGEIERRSNKCLIGGGKGSVWGLLTFYIVFCSAWGAGTFKGVLGVRTAGFVSATDGEVITVELESSDCVLDAGTLDSVVVVLASRAP